ncbi:PREDICTED: bestrophin-2-like [Nicrophorus vespilloides]|uniref:Bestrophin homolog n=1 Tax=Nicrophorus vespilloides TaxID=110193 RepID=A0ABM1N7R9_NICVS|nr:PREDICTED: bestrophin-2-like [Nicrophorus vespilloides]
MTVTYTSQVSSTNSRFSIFVKLLFRWKASIYKLIWRDLIVFLALYYAVYFLHIYGFNEDAKKWFQKIVIYCRQYYSLIPLSFVLGFYVDLVMNRFWDQYQSIPYPDTLAIILSASMQQQSERSRLARRSIMRYICLSFAITMSMISPKAKKRFPKTDHFVEAGLMLQDEKKIYEELEAQSASINSYLIPIAWAANLVIKSRDEGLITSDIHVRTVTEEIAKIRNKCGELLDFDWISIPLVYTQVVTLAVYWYFLTTIVAHQFVDADTDLHFPYITILEFFFYMGWLKVAEALINPFGDDDDDFEVNWLIDRHVNVSYLLVDKMHHQHPTLGKDLYWDSMVPQHLPYTVASEQYSDNMPIASTDKIILKSAEEEIIIDSTENLQDNDGKKKKKSWIRRLFKKRSERLKHRPINQSDYIIQNMDGIAQETSAKAPENIDGQDASASCDDDSFERLKAIRQNQLRSKIKKYVTLMKYQGDGKVDEDDSLIEEIINN